MLFFIELGSRRCTSPAAARTERQLGRPAAHNLSCSLAERSEPLRFLIHDRDSKFTRAFDEVFASEGLEIIRTSFRAPRANAVAERFVRAFRAECLDWT